MIQDIIESVQGYLKAKDIPLDSIMSMISQLQCAYVAKDKLAFKQLLKSIDGDYIQKFIDLVEYMDFEPPLEKEKLKKPEIDLLSKALMTHIVSESKIVKWDIDMPYSDILDVCKNALRNNANGNYEKCTIPFVIANNFKATGLVSAQIFDSKKQITLARIDYLKKDDKYFMSYFGEPIYDSRKIPVSALKDWFFVYRFRRKDKEYLLLSPEAIEIGAYLVEGMQVTASDDSKVGETLKIPTTIDIIFAFKLTPNIKRATPEETWAYAATKTEDDWFKLVRGTYYHPKEIEKLLLSLLLSGDFQEFPLHLAIVAPPGTGKSHILECLNAQFQEDQGIFSGSSSTEKGLIPSFGGATFNEGYLCSTRRIALVDEFLTTLYRNASNMSPEFATARMREILEHKLRMSVSGKGKILVNPKSRVIFAMNPSYSMPTLMEMVKILDPPFMTRILWYFQTPQHIEFIEERKAEVGVPLEFPKHDDTFLSIIDYTTNFSLINSREIGKEIMKIVEKNRIEVPSELVATFYNPRAIHHIGCLLDGVAKANSLIEKRGEFKIIEKDITETDEIFSIIVHSWFPINLKKMPLAIRKYYLKSKDREIYEWICEAVNPTRKAIAESFSITPQAMDFHLNELLDADLIVKVNEEELVYYAFWRHKAREVTASKEEFEKALENGEMKALD